MQSTYLCVLASFVVKHIVSRKMKNNNQRGCEPFATVAHRGRTNTVNRLQLDYF